VHRYFGSDCLSSADESSVQSGTPTYRCRLCTVPEQEVSGSVFRATPFRVAVLLKGLDGALEAAGGIALLAAPPGWVIGLIWFEYRRVGHAGRAGTRGARMPAK
jgi:hypothetical protein